MLAARQPVRGARVSGGARTATAAVVATDPVAAVRKRVGEAKVATELESLGLSSACLNVTAIVAPCEAAKPAEKQALQFKVALASGKVIVASSAAAAVREVASAAGRDDIAYRVTRHHNWAPATLRAMHTQAADAGYTLKNLGMSWAMRKAGNHDDGQAEEDGDGGGEEEVTPLPPATATPAGVTRRPGAAPGVRLASLAGEAGAALPLDARQLVAAGEALLRDWSQKKASADKLKAKVTAKLARLQRRQRRAEWQLWAIGGSAQALKVLQEQGAEELAKLQQEEEEHAAGALADIGAACREFGAQFAQLQAEIDRNPDAIQLWRQQCQQQAKLGGCVWQRAGQVLLLLVGAVVGVTMAGVWLMRRSAGVSL